MRYELNKTKIFFNILKKSLPIGSKKDNPYIFLINKELSGQSTIHYLESIVGPASKLHITILVIEGEPSNVNLTGGFEYSRRNISTAAFVRHNHVGWESSIKLLVSAEMHSFTQGGKTVLTKNAPFIDAQPELQTE